MGTADDAATLKTRQCFYGIDRLAVENSAIPASADDVASARNLNSATRLPSPAPRSPISDVRFPSSPVRLFFHPDTLGSTVALIDSAGSVDHDWS